MFGKSIREQRMKDRIREAKEVQDEMRDIKVEIKLIKDEVEVLDLLKELNEEKEVLVNARDKAKGALASKKNKDVS